jgi:hypothetical protein
MDMSFGDRRDFDAFAFGCLQVLLNIATWINDYCLLGSLAADHVRRVSQNRVVKVFEQHRANSFENWQRAVGQPFKFDFLNDLAAPILPHWPARLIDETSGLILKYIDIFRYVKQSFYGKVAF